MNKIKTQKFNGGYVKMYLKRLKILRINAGLKQTDIADILGIQQTVYSRYERGFQTIPLHLNRTNNINSYPDE